MSQFAGGPGPQSRLRARTGLGTVTVVRAYDVTARMRRVEFTGEGLRDAVSTGPGERVKVTFPERGRFTGDPAEEAVVRRRRRTYTLVDLDPRAGTARIDFVLHPGGVGAAWAAAAQPGDQMRLTSPAGGFTVPGDAGEIVLIADETGLPAAQAIAASLPGGASTRAYLEIADPGERQEVPSPANLSLTWLERDGAPYGEPMTALADRLTGAGPGPGEALRADAVVWIAGESAAVRTLRTALITQAGLDRHRIDAVAYWTQGR